MYEPLFETRKTSVVTSKRIVPSRFFRGAIFYNLFDRQDAANFFAVWRDNGLSVERIHRKTVEKVPVSS